jgi:hypothetical protein
MPLQRFYMSTESAKLSNHGAHTNPSHSEDGGLPIPETAVGQPRTNSPSKTASTYGISPEKQKEIRNTKPPLRTDLAHKTSKIGTAKPKDAAKISNTLRQPVSDPVVAELLSAEVESIVSWEAQQAPAKRKKK